MMKTTSLLLFEKFFKWVMIASFISLAYCWLYKDVLPKKEFYNSALLKAPIQTKSDKKPFYINTHDQEYLITPQFDYELEGVIVTYNNAEQFGNIWHIKRWKDFINLRDLCVVWGSNINTGVYKEIAFSSDSWTCWVMPKTHEAAQNFSMLELSNNHVLVDNDAIKKKLMSTEKGDHIRFKGMLVNYANENTNYTRGTSITREDTGNGACETIYLTSFDIIKKANKNLRKIYNLSKYLFLFSFSVFFILMCMTPKTKGRRRK